MSLSSGPIGAKGLRVSVMGAGAERLAALAEAGRRLTDAATLDEVYPLAAELALEVLAAASVSMARVEHDRGLVRVLRNAGDLVHWEQPAPPDETYEITRFPLLAQTPDRARPWVAQVDDPAMAAAYRDLLASMGRTSSIWLPLIVHGTLWGGVGATRGSEAAVFDATDVAAGEAYAALLCAALTRIAQRDELLDLAYRDALTGLGNRRAIDDHLERLLSPPMTPTTVAVVLCDVNGLKRVNDGHGHDAGDRLLREVGSLITRVASTVPGCLAGRIGGDEFCLVVEDITEIDLQRLTERLTEGAASLPMGAGLSCGWSRTSQPSGAGSSPNEAARALLRLADAAQYRAKRSGREAVAAGSAQLTDQPTTGETATKVVARALERLASCGADIEQRLTAIASAFVDVADAAGWALSVSTAEGTELAVVRQADARPRDDGDHGAGNGRWRVDDRPATLAASQGGTLYADLVVGDRLSRHLLATQGYDEVIGAGASSGEGECWLLEVMGDAMSSPLAPHQGLLRALVALARSGEARGASRWLENEQLDGAVC